MWHPEALWVCFLLHGECSVLGAQVLGAPGGVQICPPVCPMSIWLHSKVILNVGNDTVIQRVM